MQAALVVPVAIQFELIEHAERESPREAVGILGGRGAFVMRVMPLRNCAAGQHTFFADPYEQYLESQRALARDGLEIVALYHSHPGGGALPSEADREFSAIWRCAQVIVAPTVTSYAVPQMRAYRWADSDLCEVPVHVW